MIPILDAADQVYVSVHPKSGPHVTPELFTVSGGRLVCCAAASTVKVKCARRDPIVGIAGRSTVGTFAALARVEVVDPAHPIAALKTGAAAVSSPLKFAHFVRDNAVELTGAAFDALFGRLGLPPQHRAVLVMTVDAVAADFDGRTWAEGWEALAGSRQGRCDDTVTEPSHNGHLDLGAVPPDLRDLVKPTEVVLGWTRTDGLPLALPARWEGSTAVTVASSLFDATGAAVSSAAAVTFDKWTALGPTGKHGLMLRGNGSVSSRRDAIQISLDIHRATHWSGIETATAELVRSEAGSR